MYTTLKVAAMDDLSGDELTVRQKTGQLLVQRIMTEVAKDLHAHREECKNPAGIENFVNCVELQFGGVEYLTDDYDEHQVYSSTATFTNAEEVEKYGTEFVWAMKFSDFAPIPLSKMTSGRLIVGNQTISVFGVHDFFGVHHTGFANLQINSRNEITFTFSGDDNVSALSGTIQGLNEADKELIMDGSIGANELCEYIFYGVHLNSPGAVFLPKEIMDPRESAVQNTLKCFLKLSKSISQPFVETGNVCAEDIAFRQLVLKAIGTKQDQENCELVSKYAALTCAKDCIDHVRISDFEEGNNYLARLSDCSLIKNEEGVCRWVVPLQANLSSISSLCIFISNIFARYRADLNYRWYLVDRDETKALIELQFNLNTIIRGYVSLETLDTNDDLFQHCLRDVVEAGRVRIDIFEISFSWSSIVETLDVCI